MLQKESGKQNDFTLIINNPLRKKSKQLISNKIRNYFILSLVLFIIFMFAHSIIILISNKGISKEKHGGIKQQNEQNKKIERLNVVLNSQRDYKNQLTSKVTSTRIDDSASVWANSIFDLELESHSQTLKKLEHQRDALQIQLKLLMDKFHDYRNKLQSKH